MRLTAVRKRSIGRHSIELSAMPRRPPRKQGVKAGLRLAPMARMRHTLSPTVRSTAQACGARLAPGRPSGSPISIGRTRFSPANRRPSRPARAGRPSGGCPRAVTRTSGRHGRTLSRELGRLGYLLVRPGLTVPAGLPPALRHRHLVLLVGEPAATGNGSASGCAGWRASVLAVISSWMSCRPRRPRHPRRADVRFDEAVAGG